MRFHKNLTIGEFAAIVASKLEEKGISVVLTGGSVVSIYTENKYESHDADFITEEDNKTVNAAMTELGFTRKGKDFTHPDTDFFVEFPKGPLAVGSQEIRATGQIEINGHTLKLLSPTESVMDRLAGYFHWNDRQNLEQALMIANRHPIKLAKVKQWADKEGNSEKYRNFLTQLKKPNLYE